MATANFPVMLRMMASTLMSCGGEGRLRNKNNPTPMFYSIISNMLGGHKCVRRTKFMNLCNTSAVWRSECATDIQSLCFPSLLLSVFSITLLIVHMHSMDYVHANQTTGTLKIRNHLRLPCGVLFSENLFDFLTTAKNLSSISCLYQCSP